MSDRRFVAAILVLAAVMASDPRVDGLGGELSLEESMTEVWELLGDVE